MSRVVKLIGVAWCFALLILPGTLYLLGKRSSNVENRTLVPYPQRTLANIYRISTYRHSGDALIDRLPLRDRAIELKSRVLLAAGDNPNPSSAVVGEDGWIYITDEVLCDAPGVTTKEFVQNLAIARSAVLAAGKRFAFAIVPTKMVQEDRHFGRHHAWEQCARNRQIALRRETENLPGAVDLWSPLDALSAANRDVFWRTDSHLGPRGKLAYAQALEAAVEPERSKTIKIGLGPAIVHLGDTAQLTGFRQFEEDRPLIAVTTPATPPPPSRPILVLGDSQTEEIQGELGNVVISSFSFCHWDKGFWNGACDQILRQADVIAIETVARAAWRRTEIGFGVRILGVLLPIIPAAPAEWSSVSGGSVRSGRGETLTGPHTLLRLKMQNDRPERRRLIRLVVDTSAVGGRPSLTLLVDGKLVKRPLTSVAVALSGVEQVLEVPAGVALSRTRVAIDATPGTTVSEARVSLLG